MFCIVQIPVTWCQPEQRFATEEEPQRIANFTRKLCWDSCVRTYMIPAWKSPRSTCVKYQAIIASQIVFTVVHPIQCFQKSTNLSRSTLAMSPGLQNKILFSRTCHHIVEVQKEDIMGPRVHGLSSLLILA